MKILVTAFDPFGSDEINPALEALKLVDPNCTTAELIKLEIPTKFKESLEVINKVMIEEKPDAVLAIGQAGGRTALTPERVAINIQDASIKDNAGFMPTDVPVIKDGPAAYFSTLPIKEIVSNLREAGLPATVSDSAGTFVCNNIMYGILDHQSEYQNDAIGGFLHVPFIPSQVATADRSGQASMSLQEIVKGVEISIQSIEQFLKGKDRG